MSCSLHTVSGLSGSVLVCDGDSLALSLCYIDCGVQISVAACCPETHWAKFKDLCQRSWSKLSPAPETHNRKWRRG